MADAGPSGGTKPPAASMTAGGRWFPDEQSAVLAAFVTAAVVLLASGYLVNQWVLPPIVFVGLTVVPMIMLAIIHVRIANPRLSAAAIAWLVTPPIVLALLPLTPIEIVGIGQWVLIAGLGVLVTVGIGIQHRTFPQLPVRPLVLAVVVFGLVPMLVLGAGVASEPDAEIVTVNGWYSCPTSAADFGDQCPSGTTTAVSVTADLDDTSMARVKVTGPAGQTSSQLIATRSDEEDAEGTIHLPVTEDGPTPDGEYTIEITSLLDATVDEYTIEHRGTPELDINHTSTVRESGDDTYTGFSKEISMTGAFNVELPARPAVRNTDAYLDTRSFGVGEASAPLSVGGAVVNEDGTRVRLPAGSYTVRYDVPNPEIEDSHELTVEE